jgi:hypothetical protein
MVASVGALAAVPAAAAVFAERSHFTYASLTPPRIDQIVELNGAAISALAPLIAPAAADGVSPLAPDDTPPTDAYAVVLRAVHNLCAVVRATPHFHPHTLSLISKATLPLVNNPSLPRDCVTAAAMTLCLYLTRTLPADRARAALASLTRVAPSGGGGGDAEGAEVALALEEALPSPSVYARVALMRGALGDDASDALTALNGEEPFIVCLVHALCELCAQLGDPHLLAYAIYTLDRALTVFLDARLRCPLVAKFTPPLRERALRVALLHYDDPFPGVTDAAHSIFGIALSMRNLLSDVSTPSYVEEIKSVCALSLRRRGTHLMLRTLATVAGPGAVISAAPHLVVDLLKLMDDPALAGSAAGLFLAYAPPDRAADEVVRCLFSKTITVRNAVLTNVLPELLKSSEAVEDFASRITSHPPPPCQDPDWTHDDGKMWAIIALARAARRNGFVDAAALDDFAPPHDVPPPLPPAAYRPLGPFFNSRLFAAAISHRSEDMRAHALEFMGGGVRLAEGLTGAEQRLALHFLVGGALKGGSPAFRQRVCEALKRALVRLRLSEYRKRREGASPPSDGALNEFEFVAELSARLFASLFPGAAVDRKLTVLDFLSVIFDVWLVGGRRAADASLRQLTHWRAGEQRAVEDILFAPPNVEALVHGLTDPFESVRRKSFDLLSAFSAPLQTTVPHRQAFASLRALAMRLLKLPRTREAEAGAAILRLCWLKIAPALYDKEALSQAMVEEARALTDEIFEAVKTASSNFEPALASSFVHGPLVGLRFLLRDLPPLLTPPSPSADPPTDLPSTDALWRDLLPHAMRVAKAVNALALHKMDLSPPERVLKPSLRFAEGPADEDGDGDPPLGPREQLVVVACWLSLRESALLLAHVATHLPLADPRALPPDAVVEIGEELISVIFSTLHNGAIEKARVGLEAVAARLMAHPSPSVRAAPAAWLARLLDRVDDPTLPFVRRSCQLSMSILAILGADRSSPTRTLVAAAIARLLDRAACADPPVDPTVPGATSVPRARVHALNVLRQLFLDTNLSADVITHFPASLRVALSAFRSSFWSVRNSASLLFAVLVSRAMGGGTQRRAFTANEFLYRFPEIRPDLIATLDAATAAASSGDLRVGGSGGGGLIDFALQPLLTLFSALKPMASEVVVFDGQLSPFFLLFKSALAHRALLIREMAANALVPLVSPRTAPRLFAETLEEACRVAGGKGRQNFAHGLVLHGLRLFQEVGPLTAASDASAEIRAAWGDVAGSLAGVAALLCDGTVSNVTRAAIAELLHEALRFASFIQCHLFLEAVLEKSVAAIASHNPSDGADIFAAWTARLASRAALALARGVGEFFEAGLQNDSWAIRWGV